jgi:HK97 family phage portal protein
MWPFRTKAATGSPSLSGGGGFRRVLEPFTQAFQLNQELSVGSLSAYPTLYACIDRISSDIGKLPFVVKQPDSNGINRTVDGGASGRLLDSPNGYQTASQFREAWIISKLTHGNALILKQPDALHVLDWERVEVLVSDGGSVFYKLRLASRQNLLPEQFGDGEITIPASDVIHDRINCLNHQLIGVPPMAAAYLPALKNHRILENNAELFKNGSQMGGLLSAPAGISDDDAAKLRDYWKATKPTDVRVLGMEAKFTPFVANGVDSQLVEQLKYSDIQIAQAFGVPPYLIGQDYPSGLQPEQVINMYFRTTLQAYVVAMESLLTAGMPLAAGQHVTLDTSVLLRLDTARRAEVYGGLVAKGIFSTNEARAEFDLPPVDGGDQILRQQQDVPLASLGGEQ